MKFPIQLGGSRPADQPDAPISWEYTDPRFTHDWIEEHVSEDTFQAAWDQACENGWEQLQDFAGECFDSFNKVYSEGRSGGWAVVDGLPDFDTWDAIMLGQWAKFAKFARACADDVPYQAIVSLYLNEWEQAQSDAALVAASPVG